MLDIVSNARKRIFTLEIVSRNIRYSLRQLRLKLLSDEAFSLNITWVNISGRAADEPVPDPG